MTPQIQTALLCIPMFAPLALLVGLAWGYANLAIDEIKQPAFGKSKPDAPLILIFCAVTFVSLCAAFVVFAVIGFSLTVGHFPWMRGSNANKFPIEF